MTQKEIGQKALAMRCLMPPAAAAEYLGGVVIGTLAKWRHFGEGPAYVKVGSRVFYDRADLDAFIDAGRRTSTKSGRLMRAPSRGVWRDPGAAVQNDRNAAQNTTRPAKVQIVDIDGLELRQRRERIDGAPRPKVPSWYSLVADRWAS